MSIPVQLTESQFPFEENINASIKEVFTESQKLIRSLIMVKDTILFFSKNQIQL
jgi:hypothetical protein